MTKLAVESVGKAADGDELQYTDADLETSVPFRFARVVANVPAGHVACHSPTGSLTYARLDQLSNQLAALLVERLGCGQPGAQLAIVTLLPHGAVSLIGLMAVLKAGHFYVPLEPDIGAGFARQIVDECDPKAILTTPAWRLLAQSWGCDTPNVLPIVLDDHWLDDHWLDDPRPFSPLSALSAGMLASVLYTSGSTGQPNGVLRTHAQNQLLACVNTNESRYGPRARVAHVMSYAYGASAGVIFGALLSGATLCSANTLQMSATDFHHWLDVTQITSLQCAPSVLRALARIADEAGPLTALISVSTGMEPIQRETVERLARLLTAGCRLIFRYGATEVGLATRFMLHVGEEWNGSQTPAGYPVPHAVVYIADDAGQLASFGEPGQICVRGRYISPGYWNRPDLNAARFLPDPDGGDRRIFLTGDRGRMDADGLLHHLGRIDFMVKVRGYRVEPESIERVLLAHPNLSECVVIARPSRDGSNQLIAYLVVREQPAPAVSTLRDFLAKTLPSYMIPARFVFLGKLPRNANAKVDRSALPPPGKARPDLDTPFVTPRSEREQQIADIWAELLELDEVGVDDNFFELGGDSILAMRMALLVEQSVGGHVPPEFFRAPTVTYLAALSSSDRPSISLDQHPVGRRSFGKRTVKSPYPTPRRIVSQLVNGGPIWGEHCLPYGPGRRLQRLWLRLPLVRQQLLTRAAPLQEWLSILGQDDPDGSKLELSLLANTWRIWRLACIQQQDIFERYVTVHSVDRLDAAIGSGRPLILVGTHTAGSHSAMRLVIRQRTGKEFWNLGYTTTGAQDAAAKTVYARALLLQGGIVQVTGDGAKGERGVEMSIYGHPWLFRSGGAELALDTNAVMLPVFHSMTLGGHINVEFHEPLTCASSLNRTQQVDELTRQYAALLIGHLPTLVSNMRWYKLRQFQEYSNTAKR